MDENNWQFLEISKINDKIIKQLVNNLKLEISEDFFISFESLLKLGKKAEPEIEAVFHEMDDIHKSRKEIISFLLNYIKNENHADKLIALLYHPDFLIRARAIMQMREKDLSKYLLFILPLINDPDDSVRAAVINLFIKHQMKNPLIHRKLKKQAKKELNPIIRKKIEDYVNDDT